MKRAAFTLAEVLITLGIIGVVAAMTIPNLVTNYQKKANVNKLKKVYAELTQAFRLASNDYDMYSVGNDWENLQEVADILGQYLKVSQSFPSDNVIRNMSLCYDNSVKPNIKWKDRTYMYDWMDRVHISTPLQSKTPSIMLMSGACIGVTKDNGIREILIDINGVSNPNTAGYDLFFATITQDGAVLGFGYDWNTTDLGLSSKNHACNLKSVRGGYACLEKIRRDGWVINYY